MMVHNFHNFVFQVLVPICQDVVVNQYKRKVLEIENRWSAVPKEKGGFVYAFFSKCGYLPKKIYNKV